MEECSQISLDFNNNSNNLLDMVGWILINSKLAWQVLTIWVQVKWVKVMEEHKDLELECKEECQLEEWWVDTINSKLAITLWWDREDNLEQVKWWPITKYHKWLVVVWIIQWADIISKMMVDLYMYIEKFL